MGADAMILVFWMLSFKSTFSASSFTFIERLFSSLLSAIRVVSSVYLRLLIFLPVILIPAYASSSPAFLMMYSSYKLNKQRDDIQPWHTPFPVWNQSVVPCPVLTVASWPAYRFLKRQVSWSGIPISLRIFQFVVICTVKIFPGGSVGKNVCLECRRPGFDPWFGKMPWRRKWQPTPVFLPGKSHGQRSLAGDSPWGLKESHTSERLHYIQRLWHSHSSGHNN